MSLNNQNYLHTQTEMIDAGGVADFHFQANNIYKAFSKLSCVYYEACSPLVSKTAQYWCNGMKAGPPSMLAAASIIHFSEEKAEIWCIIPWDWEKMVALVQHADKQIRATKSPSQFAHLYNCSDI